MGTLIWSGFDIFFIISCHLIQSRKVRGELWQKNSEAITLELLSASSVLRGYS